MFGGIKHSQKLSFEFLKFGILIGTHYIHVFFFSSTATQIDFQAPVQTLKEFLA